MGSSDASLTNRKSSESSNKRRRENTLGKSSVKQRQEIGRASTAWAEWFEQARLDQKQALNPIYAQALQEGYDTENIIVDLGQEEREAIICDDGMLPAGHPLTTSGSDVGGKGSLCHSFKEQVVNPSQAQARQEGYDTENFIVDLGQDEREAIIGDGGMLPAGHPVTTSGSGVGGKGSFCHSFKEHRPLTGQEKLPAKCGFPSSHLSLHSFKDSELLRLARLASLLSATDTSLHFGEASQQEGGWKSIESSRTGQHH